MAITFHKSLLVAQAVVSLVLTMEEHYENQIHTELQSNYEKGIDASIESYQNCREQGFCIWVHNAGRKTTLTPLDGGEPREIWDPCGTAYHVSENRNSDNIVVYIGSYTHQAITDEAYKNAHYFRYDEHHKTAEFILEDIVERINAKLLDENDEREKQALNLSVDAKCNQIKKLFSDLPQEIQSQIARDVIGNVAEMLHKDEDEIKSYVSPSSDLQDRINKALSYAVKYGGIDGDNHKTWTIDQIVRALTGCPMETKHSADVNKTPYTYEVQGESEEYQKLVADARDGEDGPETYSWDTGIAP